MRRAAVYCRVSTDLQANKGHSLDWQRAHLPKLAQAAGAVVTSEDIFVEVMSGAKDDRPEYNRLMAAIVDGYYAEVWVVETSRLSRTEDRAEVQRVVDALQKFGCILRTPGATFDVSNIDGEFSFDIHSVVNRAERKRIRLRLLTGKESKVLKGGFGGGPTLTGYRVTGRDMDTGKLRFEIDKDQAELIRLAFDLVQVGKKITEIQQILKTKGYKGPRGGTISITQLKGWLQNPNYAGYTRWWHHKSPERSKLIEGNDFYPPIISREQFKEVQAILDRRALPPKAPKILHPLSGVIKCGNCGRSMYANSDNGRPVYYCPSRNKPNTPCTGPSPRTIHRDQAHQAVINLLPDFIAYCESRKPIRKPKGVKESPTKALEKRKAGIYAKIMRNLKDQEEEFSEFRKIRISELEAEYKDVELALSKVDKKVTPIMPSMAALSELINGLSIEDLDALRAIVSLCFSKLFFMRRGALQHKIFEITRIQTAWGTTFTVKNGRSLYFIKQ